MSYKMNERNRINGVNAQRRMKENLNEQKGKKEKQRNKNIERENRARRRTNNEDKNISETQANKPKDTTPKSILKTPNRQEIETNTTPETTQGNFQDCKQKNKN